MSSLPFCAAALAISVIVAMPMAAAQTAAQEPLLAAAGANETASVSLAPLPTARMTVAVMIGAAGPYRFIVDTAAERTVIARELARDLALAPAGSSGLLSMTSRRIVNRVHLRGLSFAQGRPRDLEAFALNGEHIGAAGVLGIDALRNHRVVLDFVGGAMTVTPPQRIEERERNIIIVQGHRRYGQLILTDSNMEGTEIDVIIDSGLDVSVGNEALRRLVRSRIEPDSFRRVSLISITGEPLETECVVVRDFRIGDVRVSNLPVAFADAYVFRRLQLSRRPVLFLGMDALQLFDRVSLDFPNRRATFVMPENAR
jgi:hypothetical protein